MWDWDLVGTVYDTVLNDAEERALLGAALSAPPYVAPPVAPVILVKPRSCIVTADGPVQVPDDAAKLVGGATVALMFGDRVGVPVAAALALNVFEPHPDYYRPPLRQRCRDTFLPLGQFAAYDPAALADAALTTTADGGAVHRWSLSRLVRPVETLIADLSEFMTLSAGDILLIGYAHDAPRFRVGDEVHVAGAGLAPLATRFEAETAA